MSRASHVLTALKPLFESDPVRKSLPVIAALAATMLLAGCTSSGMSVSEAKKNGCAGTVSGADSDSVKVSGDFLKKPTVKIDAPLKTTKIERTVLIEGDGKLAVEKSTADIALAVYNGTTGEALPGIKFDAKHTLPAPVDDAQLIPGIVRAIECLPAGSRSVTTAPVKAAFGSKDASQLGLKPTDTVVFVADVKAVEPAVPTHATGKPVAPTEGLPTVTLAKNGKPTVTIPKTDPPAKTQIAVLKQGDGATVGAGDTVTVQYQGTNWRTGKIFDQSWGKAPAQFPTTGVIPGFSKALVGQKVGSQVLAVIAPADGYGPQGGTPDGSISATDTIVFVIDILKTTK